MTFSQTGAKPTSIGRLRVLILVALLTGISLFTGVMFTLVERLSERFGPQVQADLEWRATRGAQELAKTADLGLAVSDTAMVKESFGVYAKSDDVQAIVAVDGAGQVVAQHGSFADSAIVFATRPNTLSRGAGYIASWAPAVIEGNTVGKIAVVVSTARMTEAETSLYDVKRTTMIAGVVGLVLGCVVILFFTRSIAIRDQQLHDYAHNLERKVDERTAELDERNRGMRLVLDNVAQGFITIDTNGVMANERSAIVEKWFGAIEASTRFSAVIERFDPDLAAWFDVGLDALRDDMMPYELSIAQLPRRFVAGSRTFDVTYSPILAGERVESVLVIVSDVSADIERERTERDQREIVETFQRISTDRAGFDEFFSEASDLVESLRAAGDPVTEKRVVHTLKGNCGVYGIHSFADLCHHVETEIADAGEGLTAAHRAHLVEGWAKVGERLSKLLGARKHAVIEIEPTELAHIIDEARRGVSSRELASTLASWLQEPVAVRFERLGRQATGLGRRLGKPVIQVTIEDHRVRLDHERWAGFWGSMVHAVRNAVDHGIETAAEREAAGKSPTAKLTLAATRQSGRLVITMSDDGRGVDWEALRAKAARSGLPSTTETELKEALFADGVSTREHANEMSGRGVGLGALRATVVRLGGTVDVWSEPGAGTTFTFAFPDAQAMRPPSMPLRKVG